MKGPGIVHITSLGLTPYYTIPIYNDREGRRLLKTLWKKDNMLVTSILLLFQQCFLLHQRQFLPLKTRLSSANAFKLDKAELFCIGLYILVLQNIGYTYSYITLQVSLTSCGVSNVDWVSRISQKMTTPYKSILDMLNTAIFWWN